MTFAFQANALTIVQKKEVNTRKRPVGPGEPANNMKTTKQIK